MFVLNKINITEVYFFYFTVCQCLSTVYHRLLITLHLQLLGLVLMVLILLRPLNATLIEFLVIL